MPGRRVFTLAFAALAVWTQATAASLEGAGEYSPRGQPLLVYRLEVVVHVNRSERAWRGIGLVEGDPQPLGRSGTEGVNFALFSAHAFEGRALPLRSFRPARDRAGSAAAKDGTGLARLCGGAAVPGQLYGYRVYGPYEPRRSPLQPAQAPDRSLCNSPARSPALARRALRLPSRRPSRRSDPGPARQRANGAEMRRRRRLVSMGRRPPAQPLWNDTVIYEAHVKGLTARHPDFRADPRLLCGPWPSGGHRASRELGVTAGRADADPRLRRRQVPRRQGPAQLLGLLDLASSRPSLATSARPASSASRARSARSTTPASR